jgi:hypothetical protein
MIQAVGAQSVAQQAAPATSAQVPAAAAEAPAAAAEAPAAAAQQPAPPASTQPVTQQMMRPALADAAVRDVLAASPATLSKVPVELTLGNQTLQALTDRGLTSTWQTYLQAKAPQTFATPTDAANFLRQAANSILTDPAARQGYSAFASVLRTLYQHTPLAARGISYGGQGLGSLSITGNAISDVLMGISVGVSHKATDVETGNEQRSPDHMQVVRIAGNSVACLANDTASKRSRFGIFVGNADSVEIEDNRLDYRLAGLFGLPTADGIRVVGYLGPRVIIRRNYTSGFGTGIRVMPLTGNGPGQRAPSPGEIEYAQGLRSGPLWLVADNAVTGASERATPGPFEPTKNQVAGPFAYIDAWACLLVDNVTG